MAGDRTVAMSSSSKLSSVSEAWQVHHAAGKHSNGLALDSSAFRPPVVDTVLPDTTSITSLYSSRSTTTEIEDSSSCADRCALKKSQKRARSPSDGDVAADAGAHSKYIGGGRAGASQQRHVAASTSSLTAADAFPRGSEFSPPPPPSSRRRADEFAASGACSALPMCHDYLAAAMHDGARGFSLLPSQQHDSATPLSVASTATSQSCVTSSPVAASPYLPFFSATPATNISGLYYPNPYMMLSAPPLAYRQTPPPPQFPSGWISSAVAGTAPAASSKEHVDAARASSTSAAAFDFPWMRSNPLHVSQFSPKPGPQMCDLYEGQLAAATKQYMLMRNMGGLGGALVSDGLDMYRQPACGDLASTIGANRMLLDNHPSSYLGIYPSLFHQPYLGVPSR